MSVTMDMPENFEMLSSHSPPFKVTRGDWNWHGSIGYL